MHFRNHSINAHTMHGCADLENHWNQPATCINAIETLQTRFLSASLRFSLFNCLQRIITELGAVNYLVFSRTWKRFFRFHFVLVTRILLALRVWLILTANKSLTHVEARWGWKIVQSALEKRINFVIEFACCEAKSCWNWVSIVSRLITSSTLLISC